MPATATEDSFRVMRHRDFKARPTLHRGSHSVLVRWCSITRGSRVVLLGSLFWGGCDGASSESGSLPLLQLAPVSAESVVGYTSITSVRELGDGRVLVTDPREGRVEVLDFFTGTATPVGRRGAGPEEWSSAVAVWPLGTDSSLQSDPLARRWVFFSGDRVAAVQTGESLPNELGRMLIYGADSLGNVLSFHQPEIRELGASADSASILIVRRASGRVDTVGRLLSAPGVLVGSNVRAVSRPALAVGEQAAMFVDGWIAILRLRPYRVDWRSPDGSELRGAPVEVTDPPLTESDRSLYIRDHQTFIASVDKMPPGMRDLARRAVSDFPSTLPPVQPFALVAGGDGLLYVRRTKSADLPMPILDVVDRSGVRCARIQLAVGERLQSVTQRWMYVVVIDEDNVERVRRYENVASAAANSSPLTSHQSNHPCTNHRPIS